MRPLFMLSCSVLLFSACTRYAKTSCLTNLKTIDAAKVSWAEDHPELRDASPSKADLLVYIRDWPNCPYGGAYTVNGIYKLSTCSYPGHEYTNRVLFVPTPKRR